MANAKSNLAEYKPEDYTLSTKVNIGIKTLKNYRFLSLVHVVIAALAIVVSLLTLFAYGVEEEAIAALGFSELENNFIGMALFILIVFLIIVGAVLFYYGFSYYFANTKKNITLTNSILTLVAAGFSIIVSALSITYFANSLVLTRGNLVLVPLWIVLFFFGFFVIPGVAIPIGVFGLVKKEELHLPTLKQIVVKKDFVSEEEKKANYVKYNKNDVLGVVSIVLSIACFVLLFFGWLPIMGIFFSSLIICYSGFALVSGIIAMAKESVKNYYFQRVSLLINAVLFFVGILLLVTAIALTLAYGPF